jgi:hypothetical protein
MVAVRELTNIGFIAESLPQEVNPAMLKQTSRKIERVFNFVIGNLNNC